VQPVPREAPFRLHTPVSPTGRGSDALTLKPKETKDMSKTLTRTTASRTDAPRLDVYTRITGIM
jgi:hypothetical protein